jgi:hypothetical protein
MLVVRTSKRRADPICQLVGAQQTVRLYHPAFAVDPLGLYRVEPGALLGEQAGDDPHPLPALFNLPVMFAGPTPALPAYVPARVVPD